MFGHGLTPRIAGKSTTSQGRFDRTKTNMHSFALWFTDNVLDEELKVTWIQFNDSPRVIVDGHCIKQLLLGDKDLSKPMARAVVRVLRRDESEREPGCQGICHYLVHDWAEEILKPGSTDSSPEEWFMQPKLQYNLDGCHQVVAFIKIKKR